MKAPHVHRFPIPMPGVGEYFKARCSCGVVRIHRLWEPEAKVGYLATKKKQAGTSVFDKHGTTA